MNFDSVSNKFSCNWVVQTNKKHIIKELNKNFSLFNDVFRNDLELNNDNFKAVSKFVRCVLISEKMLVDKKIVTLIARIINQSPDDKNKFIELLDISGDRLREKLLKNYQIDKDQFNYACANVSSDIVAKLIPRFSSIEDLTEGFGYYLQNPYAQPELVREFIAKGVDVNSFSLTLSSLPDSLEFSEEAILTLIELGADLNSTSINSNSLLMAVCCDPNTTPELVQKMIHAGADVNQANDDGETPLLLACFFNPRLVKVLIENQASVNVEDKKKMTPLAYTLINQNSIFETIELLITNGAECDFFNPKKNNIVHLLVHNPSVTPVDLITAFKLIPNFNSYLTQTNIAGCTPLHLAALNNLQLIAVLLELGSDPSALNNEGLSYIDLVFMNPKLTENDISVLGIKLDAIDENQQTYLHRACASYSDAIEFMLDCGADPWALDSQQNSPLHIACCNELIESSHIVMLLDEGADPNQENTHGETPFLIACKREDDIWREFLKYDANPLLFDNKGNTPLHALCLNPYVEPEDLKFFVKKGIDVNSRNKDGVTPLILATENLDLLKPLIDLEADYKVSDNKGNTLLHLVCNNPKAQTADIEYLLGLGLNINAQNESGKTPLFFSFHNQELFEFLILKGAKTDICTKEGNSLLHYACSMCESPELIELLIKKGLDVNLENLEGTTPLQFIYHPSGLDPLIKAGADATHVNKKRRNALHIACIRNLEVVPALLGLNIDVNATDLEGQTPLHYACTNESVKGAHIVSLVQGGGSLWKPNNKLRTPFALLCACNIEAARFLIVNGFVDVNSKDEKGRTELHRACLDSRLKKIISFLIRHNADVSMFDDEGNTPLHYAYTNSELDYRYIKFIENSGANLNFENKEHLTPLEMAITKAGFERVQKLISDGLDINKKNSLGQTALHRACFQHLNLIQTLLELGADPKAVDNQWLLPLIMLCTNPKAELQHLKILLPVSDVNYKTPNGVTPLICASKCNASLVDYLLEQGADFKFGDNLGNTCLHYAASSPQVDIKFFRRFLRLGLIIDIRNTLNQTPLHIACINSPQNIGHLIELKAEIDAKDNEGRTPLYSLCLNKNANIKDLLLLIAVNANINVKTVDEQTPLHAASRFAPHLIETLLKHGAMITQSKNGLTPLHVLAQRANPNLEAIASLLKYGANINLLTNEEETFLHLICISNPKLIGLALDNGAEPNALDKRKLSPLISACCCAKTEPSDLIPLFQKGADINFRGRKGFTPLSAACVKNPKLIPLLLENGAKIDIFNDEGFAPFHLACKNPRITPNEIQLFLSAGTQISDPTKNGETPLELACRYSNFEVIVALIESQMDLGNQTDAMGRSLLNLVCSNPHIGSLQIIELLDNHLTLTGLGHTEFKKNILARALVESLNPDNVMKGINAGIGIRQICEALNTTELFHNKDIYFSFMREQILNCLADPLALKLDRVDSGKDIKRALIKNASRLFKQEEDQQIKLLHAPIFLQDAELMQVFKKMVDPSLFKSFVSLIQSKSFAPEDLISVLYTIDQSHLAKGSSEDKEDIPTAPFFDLNKFNEMLAQVNFQDPTKPGYRDPRKLKKDKDPTNIPEITKGMADLIERTIKRTKKYQGVPEDQNEYERYYTNLQNLLMWFGHRLDSLEAGEQADILIEIGVAGIFCGTRYFELKNLYDVYFPASEKEESLIPILEKRVCENLTQGRMGILQNWSLKQPGQSIHIMNQLMFLVGNELYLPGAALYYDDRFAGISHDTQTVLEKFYQEYTPAAIIKLTTEYIENCLKNPKHAQEVLDWFQANPPDTFKKEEYSAILKEIRKLKDQGISRSEIREILKTKMHVYLYPDQTVEEILQKHQATNYANEYVRGSLSDFKQSYYRSIFEELEEMQTEPFSVIKMYLEDNGIISSLFKKIEDREYLLKMGIGSEYELAKFIVEEHRRENYENELILEKDWKKEEYDEIRKTLNGKSREEARRYLKHKLKFEFPKDRSFKYLLESERGMEYRESAITFDDETGKYAIQPEAIIYMLEKMQILKAI